MEDKAMTKVKDLTPSTKQVNVRVKVLGLSEEREITSKFGEARRPAEETFGDETGTAPLRRWNDRIGNVHREETPWINNGTVTSDGGQIRRTWDTYARRP